MNNTWTGTLPSESYSVEQDKLMNKYNIVITSSILKTVSVFILDNVFFFKFYFVLKYSWLTNNVW